MKFDLQKFKELKVLSEGKLEHTMNELLFFACIAFYSSNLYFHPLFRRVFCLFRISVSKIEFICSLVSGGMCIVSSVCFVRVTWPPESRFMVCHDRSLKLRSLS